MNTAASNAGPVWIKSSYSGDNGGNCLEVATQATTVHIRDSKNDPATGAILTLSLDTWKNFLRTHVTHP
ncbi:DUF397 domain-containing protein [Streptomyces sp. SGAir0957]